MANLVRNPVPPADLSTSTALKEALAMTGLTTVEELIDMANVGQSLMHAIDTYTKAPSLIEDWSPADDPAEIVGDLYDRFEESINCHKADLQRLREAEAALAAEKATNGPIIAALDEREDDAIIYVDGRPFRKAIARRPKLLTNEEWRPIAEKIIHALAVVRPASKLPYQHRVGHWMHTCFGNDVSYDKAERNYRFLEEALELTQSCGATAEDALQLVDYVFNRPAGDPFQETGGVEVTLAALCNAHQIDLDKAREAELDRVWSKADQIRAKHESKPKGILSPLPGGANG
ncbi:hypothetical protein [Sinorhizobium meliloti]|uniref:hypothetical protein n=1 Tax=Rhizobium meliloti TaxID=382 RepID=UPI001F3307BC|nr:hypothetical protein [Sinorhizobium meliloti]